MWQTFQRWFRGAILFYWGLDHHLWAEQVAANGNRIDSRLF